MFGLIRQFTHLTLEAKDTQPPGLMWRGIRRFFGWRFHQWKLGAYHLASNRNIGRS
jgi:hypothetical protein